MGPSPTTENPGKKQAQRPLVRPAVAHNDGNHASDTSLKYRIIADGCLLFGEQWHRARYTRVTADKTRRLGGKHDYTENAIYVEMPKTSLQTEHQNLVSAETEYRNTVDGSGVRNEFMATLFCPLWCRSLHTEVCMLF